MTKSAITPASAIIIASARRIFAEHGHEAQTFAKQRLSVCEDRTETEVWQAIVIALARICAHERPPRRKPNSARG